MDTLESYPLKGVIEMQAVDRFGLPKPIWSENNLGKWLRLRRSGKESRVPLVTGHWERSGKRTIRNLITNVGHAAGAGRISGQGSYNAFTYLAIGTGTTAASASDTALVTETATGGGSRAAATLSQVTTTVTNDTAQLVVTWTFTASFAITEGGVFDASSAGNMMARQVWSAVNVVSGDQYTLTWKVSA